ncbi:MAG: sodium/proline symporter [Bacteroidales bacterium]|nr:sodium/proline symporter [Bacteroidales bacterium]
MDEIQNLILDVDHIAVWSFIAYLVMIIAIGIYAARFSSKGISNFFIGGRKMSMLVVALSAVVSGRSAWLLLGVTGMSFTIGFSAVWAVLGYTLVEFFLFFFYAPRIRRFSERYDCITLPDFFAERFGDHNGRLRAVVVSIIIIFMIAYVSAQFVAGGKAFQSSFNLTETQGILLTTVIVLFYTMIGGFLAVSLTDTIQGLFMIIALLVLPVIAISGLGGFSEFYALAGSLDQGSFFNPLALSAGVLIGFLGIGLGSPGNPHIIARYMSIKNAARLKMVALVGTAANVLMGAGAIITGMAGRLYFHDASLLPGGDPENLYPLLAGQLLHPIMFGIIIASIFAAIMSTADSQLLVAASALVRDIYEKLLHKKQEVPQKKLVMLSRVFVVLLVLLALLLGLVAEKLVFWLVLFAWAGLGAAFGPASILALFWKGSSRTGIIAGMITGAVTVIVWTRIPLLAGFIYELIPGFTAALIVSIVVSRFTKKPGKADELYRAGLN